MKKLKAWMAEHKKFSVIALCLLLMFTCGSAMSAINVSHHRAETAKEQNAGNNTDTTTAAEKKTKEETGKVELTDQTEEERVSMSSLASVSYPLMISFLSLIHI